MTHGVLFLAYVVVTIVLAQMAKWSFKKLAVVLVMSVIPFGTFWMEKNYLEETSEVEA